MGKLKDELKRYNATVLDHFMNPRNVGDLADATARGGAENPRCRDLVRYAVRVEGGRVAAIRMKTFGCTIAIASASAVTELALGRAVREALELSLEDLVRKLGSIPEDKLGCTTAAREALRNALLGADQSAEAQALQ
jgi:nitrogen fixation NifU-like protein